MHTGSKWSLITIITSEPHRAVNSLPSLFDSAHTPKPWPLRCNYTTTSRCKIVRYAKQQGEASVGHNRQTTGHAKHGCWRRQVSETWDVAMPQDAKWKRKEVSGGKKQTANFEAPSKDAIFSSDISELITRMDFCFFFWSHVSGSH